jgi:hypothetical protein
MVTLNGMHLARQVRQNCRLVARAGANLKDLLLAGKSKQLGHQGNDIRLGDGLPTANWQWTIAISMAAVLRQDEEMARYIPHSLENSPVADIPPEQLLLHHALAFVKIQTFLVHQTHHLRQASVSLSFYTP